MAQPPSFPFYPADWLLGTLTFSLAEDGAYLRLVMHQWHSGSVPGDDLSAVAKILRVSEREARPIWKAVAGKFVRGDDGLWRNARVEKQRTEKVRYHEAQAEKGRRSAEHRLNRGSTAAPTVVDSRLQPDGQPEPNLSLALVPEPTVQTDARAQASTEHPVRRGRPNPYAHAVVQAPNGRMFWQGAIFDIPHEWARKTLAAANGKAAGSEIVLFATALTERLQRERGEAPTQGFLGWLDTEWTAWRNGRRAAVTGEAEARRTVEFIAEHAAIRANLDPVEKVLEGLRAGRTGR